MTKTVLATIKWIDPLRGQRFVVPSSAKYGPIIRFSDQKLSDEGSWSAIIVFKKRNPDGSVLAELSYLVNLHRFIILHPEINLHFLKDRTKSRRALFYSHAVCLCVQSQK